MNNNQPIIIKNPQQPNIPITTTQIPAVQPVIRLLNNPQLNDTTTIKYNSVPMTRKNYTYMANVNIPSVTHIIAPANSSNNQPILPQVNSMKLPRVLPPPNNNSFYTTTASSSTATSTASAIPISSATSGVLSSRGSSCIGTPKLIQRRESFIPMHDTSSPIYKRDSISPSLTPFKSIDSNSRRHSVSLAVLDDPLQTMKHNNTIGAIVKDENKDLLVPLVQIKSEDDLNDNLPQDNSLLHNVGERYNEKGELIGRSGKILRDTKRAAQNRCAQKAFRIRREKYIKNLEIKSKEFDGIVTENNKLKLKIQELEKLLQPKQ